MCGHYELVELLLESGALADPESFERERAVYNALNNKIRNLLLSYDYSKTADPLQQWSSHITSLLSRDTPTTSDIILEGAAESFRLHKFLLSARSPYFMRKFADAPETAAWKLSHVVPVEAFRAVLRYLYLGNLPRDFVDPGSAVSEAEVFKGIDKLCKHLEIEKLWEAVLSINDRRLARQRQQDEVQRAQEQVEKFFEDTVLKHRIVVDTRKVDDVKWPHDNAIFANCLLRADEQPEDGPDPDTKPVPNGNAIPIGPAASEPTPLKPPSRSVLFPVHKAFLIRSPYFETMFSSSFLEAQSATSHLHIIKADCTPAVLEIVLRFLYTEKVSCPLPHALDLLYTADMLLLDKLKTKAAVTIATLGSGTTTNVLVERNHSAPRGDDVEPINIYDVLHAAWDLKVQRLEEFAARYLASRLEDYIDDEEFAELIRESAARLKERQETDTIELLDDIRYFLSERFRFRFEADGLEEMLDERDYLDGTGADDVRGEVAGTGVVKEEEDDRVKALNGEFVSDEFVSDGVNYHLLMNKIDEMLERLELGA